MKNLEILEACKMITFFCSNYAKLHEEMPSAKKMIKATEEGSIIHSLIKDNNWDDLFQNADWFLLLDAAQNLSLFSKDNIVIEKLMLLLKYFPEQTKSCTWRHVLLGGG